MGRQELQVTPSASDPGSTLGLSKLQPLHMYYGNPGETQQGHSPCPHSCYAETDVQRNSTRKL